MSFHLPPPEEVEFLRLDPADLPGCLLSGDRVAQVLVRTLSAAGAEVALAPGQDDRALAPDPVIVVPSIGEYRARRLWRSGDAAAYAFALTGHSRRALDALIRDRFRAA
jgi:hypothetical protein